MVGQIVKGDLALDMTGNHFELIGGIVQQDMIDEDPVRVMRPKLLLSFSGANKRKSRCSISISGVAGWALKSPASKIARSGCSFSRDPRT